MNIFRYQFLHHVYNKYTSPSPTFIVNIPYHVLCRNTHAAMIQSIPYPEMGFSGNIKLSLRSFRKKLRKNPINPFNLSTKTQCTQWAYTMMKLKKKPGVIRNLISNFITINFSTTFTCRIFYIIS
jgi:hypothetical protein